MKGDNNRLYYSYYMHINEITIEDINRLKDIQLSQLLHYLLRIELEKNEILGEAFVPFNITTGDEGEDGRVQWIGQKESTSWFRNRICIFQNKATNLPPRKCSKELMQNRGESPQLKDSIRELVDSDGCYVLFTTVSLNTNQKKKRIEKFREAIQAAGHNNYNTFCIEVYDANSIKDWVNENITTVTLVQKFNDKTRPGFIIWKEWEKILSGSSIPYQTDSLLDQHRKNILEKVIKGETIRIIGHSGLGKTRLVLETFRKVESKPRIEALQNQLVYFDLSQHGESSILLRYIMSHEKQEGILIVDNCEEEAHRKLSNLVNSIGRFKLITIDKSTDTDEELFLKLDRKDQRDIVKSIIEDRLLASHDKNDIDYLSNMCEGYPWMAVEFFRSIQRTGFSDFNSELPRDFIKHLLFGRDLENEIEYNIIRACSIFSSFGFLDSGLDSLLDDNKKGILREQMKFVREVVYDGELSESKFYKTCKDYVKKGIIEQLGTQYLVKPTVLAINLAADWISNTPPDRVKKILIELQGKTLGQKYVERLRDLDQIDEAQDIVYQLWGIEGPFGEAEVLNTEWGSLLFRHVVEVNPKAMADTLHKSFNNLTKSEVKEIRAGRRNLVLALEKLCFRKETFPVAAKLLYSFAVSENESWANNSENQFYQLYRIYLAGTEADFNNRLTIIEWGLEKQDDDYNRIAINALGQGILHDDRYRRWSGTEAQGSRIPLKDYTPSNWDEIYNYWDKSIKILTDFACEVNSHQELAKTKLANAFKYLIRYGKLDLVIETIRRVITFSSSVWPEGLYEIKRVVNSPDLPTDMLIKIEGLIKDVTPTDLKYELRTKVTMPKEYSYKKDERGNYIDGLKIDAEELAEKIVDKNLNWFDEIPSLLVGEQKQAFNFGNRIGELVQDKVTIIDKLFAAFSSIPKEQRNPSLIAGFVYGSRDAHIKEKAINLMLDEQEYHPYAFYLTRILNPKSQDLNRLFDIVGEGKLSINYFEHFKNGRVLDHLKTEEIIDLCTKIAIFGLAGAWTSLSIISMYCYKNDDRWAICKNLIKDLICRENMLHDEKNLSDFNFHHWIDGTKKILIEDDESNFSEVIATQIIEFYSNPNYNYDFSSYVTDIIKVLLNKYFDTTWEIIGEGLLGEYTTFYNLQNAFKARFQGGKRKSVIFENPSNNKKIIAWIKNNIDVAPERIARIVPIENIRDGEINWHSFTKSFIDEFGGDKEVLNNLAVNMESFSFTGSLVPHYKRYRKLFEELLEHPSFEVREWANNGISYMEKRIKQEKLKNEERLL